MSVAGPIAGLFRDVERLAASADPADPVSPRWMVLRTRSRQEKVVERDLKVRECRVFLPTASVMAFHGHGSARRRVRVDRPLFPGYVFLHGTADHAFEVDRLGRLAQVMKVLDQPRLHWELKNLATAIDAGVSLDPYPYLAEGVRVEVRTGPLRGVQGFVEGRLTVDKLVIQVQMLGRGVSVEVDGGTLEAIGEENGRSRSAAAPRYG